MSLARGQNPLPAVGAAFALAALYALLASAEPGRALGSFFLGPFSSPYAFFTMLDAAGPLLVAATGSAIAFRSGRFNLGGEGQAALGLLAAALVLQALPASPAPAAVLPAIALALLAAAAAGALLALASGFAERASGAEVLLTSFLLGQIALIAVDWAIAGPLRDPSSNLLAMPPFAPAFRLPRLAPPSSLNAGVLLALVLAGAAAWLLRGTRSGYELRLHGENPAFARAQGLDPGLDLWPLALSGALHGIAGALLLLGGSGRAVRGLTGGVGWNGISVALVAGTGPIAAIPASLFFAFLDAGARSSSILSDLSPDASAVMKAVVLLLVTARFPARRGRPEGALPAGRWDPASPRRREGGRA